MRFKSTPTGEDSNSGGCTEVKPRPMIVRAVPHVNNTTGAANSIIPRALRLGIGCRSGLFCPIVETRLNGHSGEKTGKAKGMRCEFSTSNAFETKILA